MTGPRTYAGATLLADGRLFIAAGENATENLATCEIFDPATKKWTMAAPCQRPHAYGQSMTRLQSGDLLIAGGEGERGGSSLTADVERYQVGNGSWRPAAKMRHAVHWHTATLLKDGKVLVTGGRTGSRILRSADLYDAEADRWTNAGSMTRARTQHSATLLRDGRVLIVGG
jgi:N-acetylneuraminic acid mutarotase